MAPFAAVVEDPLQQLHHLARSLGIAAGHTPTELADRLRSQEADKILVAGDALKFWHNHDLFNFGPVIEHNSDANAYLVEHPQETISKGNYEHRAWLTGLVSSKGEGAGITLRIYSNHTLRNELNQNFDEKIMKLLGIQSEEKLQLVIGEYMQGVHELNDQTSDGFFELFSDYNFFYPVYKTLGNYLNYADVEKSPAYIYRFSYHGPYTYAPFYRGNSSHRFDVVHLDDSLYQFRQSALFPDFEKDSIDFHLMQDFVGTLVEFVKTG